MYANERLWLNDVLCGMSEKHVLQMHIKLIEFRFNSLLEHRHTDIINRKQTFLLKQ